jgi:hypothetical protein
VKPPSLEEHNINVRSFVITTPERHVIKLFTDVVYEFL